MDKQRVSALMTTDLTSAFDTVDRSILVSKLDHYGVRGIELDIITDYLTDRQQFVQIDTFNSDIIKCPPCSVVQGGKLSGVLYTLYTNEIPLLFQLMNKQKFQRITNKHLPNITTHEHQTTNFIDDSSSVISFKHTDDIKLYLENYYSLLENYYEINQLHINSDKTQLLLCHKPKHKECFKNFSFRAGKYKIKAKSVIKILGFLISSDLKMDSQVGKISGELHNRMYEFNKIAKYMNFKTRVGFMHAYVLGKLNYGLPLYFGISTKLHDKFHKVLMRAARISIGSYCPRKSISYILGKCKMVPVTKMIGLSACNFFYKLIIDKSPVSILELFMKQNTRQKTDILRPIYRPETKIVKGSLIHMGAAVFNSLPNELKTGDKNKFSSKLWNYMNENKAWDPLTVE